MTVESSLAMACAVVLDRTVGEPPARVHPVVAFGSAMARVERWVYADSRVRGAVYTCAGVVLAAAVGGALRCAVGRWIATVGAGTLATAGRMLEREGLAVARLLRVDDLGGARAGLGALVGRSTADLDEHEIARAVVESLAENTVDAVTATVWWGTVAGPVGVAVHRAVNTMDAVVGHRSPRYLRFGWASARLDDAVNWLPARITVLAVMIASPRRAGAIRRVVRRDAGRHPSPNAGVIEAAFAAALDVRLGGINRYHETAEDRGALGDGRPPSTDDIVDAALLARRVSAIATLLCVAGSVVARSAARSIGERR